MMEFGSEIPLQCNYCNKSFSGAIPAKQHFDSAAHKKKEATARQTASAGTLSQNVCDVCNISCDTFMILEQHKASPRHLANVQKKQQFAAQTGTHIGQASSAVNQGLAEACSPTVQGRQSQVNQEREYDFDGSRGYCYLCDIQLTSKQHATQHLNGSKHKKKQVVQTFNIRPPPPQPINPQTDTGMFRNVQISEETQQKQMMSSQIVGPYPGGCPDLGHVQSFRQGVNPIEATSPFVKPIQSSSPIARPVQSYSPVSRLVQSNSPVSRVSQSSSPFMKPVHGNGQSSDKLYCEVCDIRVESLDEMVDHLKSLKHETNLLNKSIKSSRSSSFSSVHEMENILGNNPPDYVSYSAISQQMSELMISDEQQQGHLPHFVKPEPVYGNIRENQETENKLQKFFNIDSANLSVDSLVSGEGSISYRTAQEPVSGEILAKPFPREDNSQRGLQDRQEFAQNRSDEIPDTFYRDGQREINRSVSSSSEPGPARFIRNNLRSSGHETGPTSLPVLLNNADRPVGLGRGLLKFNNDQPVQIITKQSNLIRQTEEQFNNRRSEDVHLEQNQNQCETSDNIDLSTMISNLKMEDNNNATESPSRENENNNSIKYSEYSIDAKPFPSETTAPRPNVQEYSIDAKPFTGGTGDNITHPSIDRQNYTFQGTDNHGQENRCTMPGIQLLTPDKRESEYIFDRDLNRGHCNICNLALTSVQHMEQHLSGRKHKNAKALKLPVSGQPMSNVGPEIGQVNVNVTSSGMPANNLPALNQGSGVIESRPGFFYCDVCKVETSGEENYQRHLKGEKHRKKLTRGGTDKPDVYVCDICKVECSGEDNYKQHLAGEKHRKKLLAGGSEQNTSQCEICTCVANSQEQLLVHQRMKHPEMFQTVSVVGRGPFNNLQTAVQGVGPIVGDNCLGNRQGSFSNPLEEFLSLELFPEHKDPGDSGNNEPADLANVGQSRVPLKPETAIDQQVQSRLGPFPDQNTAGVDKVPVSAESRFITPEITTAHPIELKPRFATMPQANENDIEQGSGGGARKTFGSDLAFATKNRSMGNQNSSATENAGGSGSQKADVSTSQQSPRVNPFAATHSYYCHTCNAPANTRESYETHLLGKRHMAKVGIEPAPVRQHRGGRNLGPEFKPQTQSVPRDYQMELYDNAIKSDTVCFLPTGTGKTLVSVMLMSTMLEMYPTRCVLFIVDKVLLVLQQSKYITAELGGFEFTRFKPDGGTLSDLGRRRLNIATLCMDQQSTHGVPLWKHDIVVVTAAFCQNLLDRKIIRWEDFSLVVFDEAHHCDKKHPFNMLLYSHHLKIYEGKFRPKILGLTASPAGKESVPATLRMLEKLVGNMGGVSMNIVQKHKSTLAKFQSNAEIIIRPQPDQFNEIVDLFVLELHVYLVYCYLRLVPISDIQFFLTIKDVNQSSSHGKIRMVAECNKREDYFLEEYQLAVANIQCLEAENKYHVRLLGKHAESILMTLNSLLEGGVPCALEEMTGLQNEEYNFDFAKTFDLPCEKLQAIYNHTKGLLDNPKELQFDSHISRLVDELTNSLDIDWSQRATVKPMALVLVKERATVHKITYVLQNNEVMQRMNLRVTSVVGHGKTGSEAAGMKVNQQKRILEEIKQYKYQVIVATSVAEEGVDWPECELVVSLYPPSTLTALVQMRGRARKKNSKFVVLCSSEEERKYIEDLKRRENNMIEASEILYRRSLETER